MQSAAAEKSSMRTTRKGCMADIAEPWAREFVGRRPRGQHARAGISHRQKAAGFRMHHDVVAIGEIVFERKSIGRIDEQPAAKAMATLATINLQ